VSDFDDFLDGFYDDWYDAAGWFGGADQDLTNAKISYAGGDDHAALGSLIQCADHTVDCLLLLLATYQYPYPRYNVMGLMEAIDARFVDLEGAAPPAITMDAIISVMLSATEDEYRSFIGLVDAYRVGLWNKPFNSEYFAALARGFAT